MNAGTELKLFENILDCHPALDHKEVQTKMKIKMDLKTQSRDSRNLYLVKEGGKQLIKLKPLNFSLVFC